MEESQESNSPDFENRIDLSELKTGIDKVRDNLGKVIVGQKETIDLLITAILADGHVLLEGVPGIAKTLTAKLLARSLSVDFSRIQFTPDLMPSDVLGTSVYNAKIADFEFKKGPLFSNLVLIDEINRAPAKTQAALFEVMEERQISIENHRFKMDPPYVVLATQNPIEQEGTYRLPEAQLDRFLMRIVMDYPNELEETEILERHAAWDKAPLAEIEPVMTAEELLAHRKKVAGVRIEKSILKYIAQIVTASRDDSSLYLGASPRASVALLYGSRAYAAMQGRDFVTPDDVKYLTPAVMGHRVILTPESEMEGMSTREVIRQLVSKVEVPR